jgi:hypothetical protein
MFRGRGTWTKTGKRYGVLPGYDWGCSEATICVLSLKFSEWRRQEERLLFERNYPVALAFL